MAEIQGTITANNTPIEVSIIGSGPPGRDGRDGIDGFTPSILSSEIAGGHRIIINNKDSSHSFVVADGDDGVSPNLRVTEIPGGHRITITQFPTPTSFDVMDGDAGATGAPGQDGEDGADGVSPEVTVETISGGHKVTITDAEHPEGQSFNVMDGEGAVSSVNGMSGNVVLDAEDVGALPDDTVIPSDLSQLSDDATHRTVTDTEKATWNAKQDAIGYAPAKDSEVVKKTDVIDISHGGTGANNNNDALKNLGAASNPNLLVNGWLLVNQRGFTTAPMASGTRTIDGWKTYGYPAATVTYIASDHRISIEGGSASGGSAFLQTLENLPDGTYTLSVKVTGGTKDGNNYGYLYARSGNTAVGSATAITSTGITSKTFTVENGNINGVSVNCASNSIIHFTAVKLEVGSISTLANDIEPDYAAELLRCQRYLYVIPSYSSYLVPVAFGVVTGASMARFQLALPTEMRTTPALINGWDRLRLYIGGQSVNDPDVVVTAIRGNILHLAVSGTDLPAYTTCAITGYGTSGVTKYLEFSAEL